jgi:hypothetical protein
MFSWGAITIGLGAVHNYGELSGVRFLLGTVEAGLFPGLVYYLTFWYRVSERSLRVALILASATLAGAFGGAIAYGVGQMNGAHGLSAWRWLFFIEGAPSCASAILVWFFLPDYPETAHWLSSEEKELAKERLALEGSHGEASGLTWEEAKKTLVDWRLYAHYAVCDGAGDEKENWEGENMFGQEPNETDMPLSDLLRHLDAIFESFSIYPIYHGRSWVLEPACAAHDGSSLCNSICGYHCSGLVR